MSVAYPRGKQLGADDLNIFLEDSSGRPANAQEISYAIYDFTTGLEVLVGPPRRSPANPQVGCYYASIVIPLGANIGPYRIRWTFREVVGGPINQVVQEFDVIDQEIIQTPLSDCLTDLVRSMRILLRDNCVGEEEEVELDVDGERMVVSFRELWEALHDLSPPPPGSFPETLEVVSGTNTSGSGPLREAYLKGALRVQSVSPEGEVQWKRVLGVHRSEIGPERIRRLTTSRGAAIMTSGHRVYVSPTSKIEAERISSSALGLSGVIPVESNEDVGTRRFMYDLTAEDWHNFVLYRSGLVVSNSPDRNYHFRPPTHEATIDQFSRVFGYIWEDEELIEYLKRATDMVSAAPPATPFRDPCSMMQCYPYWRTLLIDGAMLHALFALQLNWIADEFSLEGDSVVTVRLPDGEVVDVSLEELHDICRAPPRHSMDSETRQKLREAYKAGALEVRSVVGDEVRWTAISDVLQHQTEHKKAFRVSVSGSSVVATQDHSLFLYCEGRLEAEATEASALQKGDPLAVVIDGSLTSLPVEGVEEVEALSLSYDLSVPGPENFILSNGIVAHNSYNIGGVSLDIEKSSKYQSAYDSKKQSWDEELDRAKQTVKIVKGLQQPRFGVGIRSAFGPYTSAGQLTPRKFIGFVIPLMLSLQGILHYLQGMI